MSAEEAAATLINSAIRIGMSGFTGSGYPKPAPLALARRITDANLRGHNSRSASSPEPPPAPSPTSPWPAAFISGFSANPTPRSAKGLMPAPLSSIKITAKPHLRPVIMKLGQIASTLKVRLENGSPDAEITGVAGIEEAIAGQITFVANPRYAAAARSTRASAVIVAEDFPAIPVAMLRSKNPYFAFAEVLELFYQPPKYAPGIHATAVIHPSARIGQNCHIGPYVVIDEGVEIGRNSVLLAHVVIYRKARIGDNFIAHAHAVVRENCSIGSNVVLQNGVIIGADGFGFAKDDSGHWHKIVQSGPAVLEDDVEVQANACVDRASVGETHVSRGAKIDNLVQVGHGSRVGEDALLCAQVGLAGSTEIGKNVILAGQVGVAGHCKVGDGAIATAQSGIPNDVPAGAVVSGYPAIDNRLWLRCSAIFNKLPEIAKTLRKNRRK